MTDLFIAQSRIGQRIKSDHPYAFRSGQWATIVDAAEKDGRVLWSLLWADGARDVWAANDPTATYRFTDPDHDYETMVGLLDTMKEVVNAVKFDMQTPGIRAPRELRDNLLRILIEWERSASGE